MGKSYSLEEQFAFKNQIEYDYNTREAGHQETTEKNQTDFLSRLLTGVTLATSATTVALFQKEQKDGIDYFVPRLVIGPDTQKDHQEALSKLKELSITDLAASSSKVSPTLEKRVMELIIPLNENSRFKNLIRDPANPYSYYGVDEQGYKPTKLDSLVDSAFRIDSEQDKYALITIKGRGKDVIAVLYIDYKFNGGDVSGLEKKDFFRSYLNGISRSLQYEDISKKLLDAERKSALAEAELRDKNLALTAAHELRNPLMVIGCNASRIVNAKNPANDMEYAKTVLDNVRRCEGQLTQLIESLENRQPAAGIEAVNIYSSIIPIIQSLDGTVPWKVNGEKGLSTRVNVGLYKDAMEHVVKYALAHTQQCQGELDIAYKSDKDKIYIYLKHPFDPSKETRMLTSCLDAAKNSIYKIGGNIDEGKLNIEGSIGYEPHSPHSAKLRVEIPLK